MEAHEDGTGQAESGDAIRCKPALPSGRQAVRRKALHHVNRRPRMAVTHIV